MKEPLFVGMPGTYDYRFDGHAGASPSGAERWMNCTGSLSLSRAFIEGLTDRQRTEFARGSSAARQGTTAHAAAESAVSLALGRIDSTEHSATMLELSVLPDEGEDLDGDMEDHISEYVDLVKQYHDEGRVILLEQRVSAVIPLTQELADGDDCYEVAGSVDFAALPNDECSTLTVGDLKYGAGVDVDVEENPQARIYALGILDSLTDEDGVLTVDTDTVEYYIIQPRTSGIKTWSEPVSSLLDWRDEVLSPALTAALLGPEGGATFTPAKDTCQWCPARGTCSALAEQRVEDAANLFTTIVEAEFADGSGAFPETASLSDERLGSLLAQVQGLLQISDDLKAEAQRRLYRGTPVPGFKLVSYSPPRGWKESATQHLARDLPIWKPPTLMTPTQALKAVPEDDPARKQVEMMIVTPEKRPVVAPEGDRRKEWGGVPAEQMFDNMEGK